MTKFAKLLGTRLLHKIGTKPIYVLFDNQHFVFADLQKWNVQRMYYVPFKIARTLIFNALFRMHRKVVKNATAECTIW